MYKNLRYKSPSGTRISNPSKAFLKDLIYNSSGSDWGKDSSGDSMLDFYENAINHYQGDVSLIFFYDEPYGFFMYYDVSLTAVEHGVSLKDDKVIEYFVGGEPMRIPSICYRNRQQAWEIIEHFIETEKPLEKFNWVMLSKIDYPFE